MSKADVMKINIIDILGGRAPLDFDGRRWLVEFGEGPNRVHVIMGPEGKIDVRSPNGNAIKIEPRSANSAWISAIPYLGDRP